MKEQQYLLDSSFLVALLDANDVHHSRATTILKRIGQDNPTLLLSDIVINKTLSVFGKRCEQKKQPATFEKLVQKFKSQIQNTSILCITELIPKNYNHIINIMLKTKGALNFHDALITLFLNQIPKVHLISFDKDFLNFKWIQLISE